MYLSQIDTHDLPCTYIDMGTCISALGGTDTVQGLQAHVHVAVKPQLRLAAETSSDHHASLVSSHESEEVMCQASRAGAI